jgi:HAD superfamily phosphatase
MTLRAVKTEFQSGWFCKAMNSPPPKAIVVFDIDGVVRDVAGSYRRAISDTVEHFTQGQFRPTPAEIDDLKAEGCWNNDWEASQELIARFAKEQRNAETLPDFQAIVDFFQAQYRGEDFSGYIQNEPLLMSQTYLEGLTQGGVLWGFFSGATRGSAGYVLEQRLGLEHPVLVAMEDAPGKPDPTGLFQAIALLSERYPFAGDLTVSLNFPIFYVGDTVADMQTVAQAKHLYPMHVQERLPYTQLLERAGAIAVLDCVEQLTSNYLRSDLLRSLQKNENR